MESKLCYSVFNICQKSNYIIPIRNQNTAKHLDKKSSVIIILTFNGIQTQIEIEHP